MGVDRKLQLSNFELSWYIVKSFLQKIVKCFLFDTETFQPDIMGTVPIMSMRFQCSVELAHLCNYNRYSSGRGTRGFNAP